MRLAVDVIVYVLDIVEFLRDNIDLVANNPWEFTIFAIVVAGLVIAGCRIVFDLLRKKDASRIEELKRENESLSSENVRLLAENSELSRQLETYAIERHRDKKNAGDSNGFYEQLQKDFSSEK